MGVRKRIRTALLETSGIQPAIDTVRRIIDPEAEEEKRPRGTGGKETIVDPVVRSLKKGASRIQEQYQERVPEEIREEIGSTASAIGSWGWNSYQDLRVFDEEDRNDDYQDAQKVVAPLIQGTELAFNTIGRIYGGVTGEISHRYNIHPGIIDTVDFVAGLFYGPTYLKGASKLKGVSQLNTAAKAVDVGTDIARVTNNVTDLNDLNKGISFLQRVEMVTGRENIVMGEALVHSLNKTDYPVLGNAMEAMKNFQDQPWNLKIRKQFQVLEEDLFKLGQRDQANIVNRYTMLMDNGLTVEAQNVLKQLDLDALPTHTLPTAAASDKIPRPGQQIIEIPAEEVGDVLNKTDAERIAHKLGQTPEQFLRDQGLLHNLSKDDIFTGNTAKQIGKRRNYVTSQVDELLPENQIQKIISENPVTPQNEGTDLSRYITSKSAKARNKAIAATGQTSYIDELGHLWRLEGFKKKQWRNVNFRDATKKAWNEFTGDIGTRLASTRRYVNKRLRGLVPSSPEEAIWKGNLEKTKAAINNKYNLTSNDPGYMTIEHRISKTDWERFGLKGNPDDSVNLWLSTNYEMRTKSRIETILRAKKGKYVVDINPETMSLHVMRFDEFKLNATPTGKVFKKVEGKGKYNIKTIDKYLKTLE